MTAACDRVNSSIQCTDNGLNSSSCGLVAVTGWARGDNDGVEGDGDVLEEVLSERVDGWSRDDGVSGREKGDILGCLAPPIEVN